MGLLAIASMTLGRLISSVLNTSEKGLPLLLVSVIGQVVNTPRNPARCLLNQGHLPG